MESTVIPPDPNTAAPAPVDQAPAQASPAPASVDVGATLAALLPVLQNLADRQSKPTAAAAAAPVDAPPAPAPAAAADYAPGTVAVYTHDHYGRTVHQLLIVVGTYTVDVPQKDGSTLTQHRVRALPLGSAKETADMPVDYEGLAPASAFDWEATAA